MAGKRIAVFSLLALAGLALALFASSGAHAQTYKPTFGYSVAISTHDTVSNTTNQIAIPGGDYNYEDSSLYTFTPIDESSTAGTAIAIADGMGTLDAAVAVGLLGGPCSTNLPPSFTLENASIDTSVVIPPGSSADPPGTNNMYWVLKPAATYTVPVAAYDPNIPDYLEAMPHFINDMLDPDGAGALPPLTAHARYAGYTTVAGMNIIIQFIVLDPGQIMAMGGIKAQMGPELGHPSLVVLDNPVSQEESPGAISDFCTPLSTTTVLYGTTTANPYDATGGGTVARTNPPEDTGVLGTGTHMARNYSQSERDADGDGHENDLDPCHYTSDAGWDPRGVTPAQPGYDTDGDGLPDSCDPVPTISNIDEDADGYTNRQDICPLVPNGCIVASCSPAFPPIYNAAWDNLADDDGFEPNADVGPGPDSIGNACDDSDCDGVEDGAVTPCSCADGIDNGPDGTTDGNDPDCVPAMDKADPDPWGANPGTGQFYHAMPWTAVTINSATDTDGDGYSDALETLLGSATGDSGSVPESLVIDATLTVGAGSPPRSGGFPALDVEQSCSDGIDNDADTLIDAADNSDLGCDPTDDSYDGDDDHDGVVDDGGTDNCGKVGTCSIWNPEQVDSDTDGIGDACDADIVGNSDGDTHVDRCDNCPTTDNEGQEDAVHPGDGGDACEDPDLDSVMDDSDNCPDDANTGQANTDADLEAGGASVVGDGLGDACDPDDDNDGFSDVVEAYLPTDQLDNCVANPPGTAIDAWPLDNNKDTYVTVGGDVLPYRGKIGAHGPPGATGNWLQRLDINADNFITVGGDVLPFRGNIGANCS